MSRTALNSQHGVYHIPGLTTPQILLIDLNHEMQKEVHVIIAPEAQIDLLILNGDHDTLLNLECATDVKGTLQIAMLKPNKNLTIKGTAAERVDIDASFVDFSPGKGKVIIDIELLGAGAHIEWRSAVLSTGNDRKLLAVSFLHTMRDTYANMTNYGVTEGNSLLHFSGTGHIINGAKNSKTHQTAKVMVFDPTCLGRADPILRIDENEVEASHAATVGKVNDEHLFYLCSRGLTKKEAKRVITLGYLNPIIQYFTDENLKATLTQAIESIS